MSVVYHGPARNVTIGAISITDVSHALINCEPQVFEGHESDHSVGCNCSVEIDVAVDTEDTIASLEALVGTPSVIVLEDPAGNTYTTVAMPITVGSNLNFDDPTQPFTVPVRGRKYCDKATDFYTKAAAA